MSAVTCETVLYVSGRNIERHLEEDDSHEDCRKRKQKFVFNTYDMFSVSFTCAQCFISL